MLLVKLVFTLVFTPILPDVIAPAMHHAILELTLKVATIGPLEAPITAHFIVRPVTAILATICPEVHSLSLFNAVLEKSMVVAAIAPNFDTLSVLLVLDRHL